MKHLYRVWNALLAALLVITAGNFLGVPHPALANNTAQTLPFSQDWSDTSLITTNDDWSNVPGIVGHLGDGNSGSPTGVDPQTLLSDPYGPNVDVIANQTTPNTNTSGGVAEFELSDPVVALQGSGTADAPYLQISLDTTGYKNIRVQYNLRDIDGSADNSVQPVALHYRAGGSGNFTNVPAAYVADASDGPSLPAVTPVDVILPPAADNQSALDLRIMTANAVGSDEWIGVDDIQVSGEVYNGDSAPYVQSSSPVAGAMVAADSAIQLTFTEPVQMLSSDWFLLSCNNHSVETTVSGSGADYTLTPAADLPAGAACLLTLTASQIEDLDGDADLMRAEFNLPFMVEGCDSAITTPIATVQGSGAASSLAGSAVVLNGVVTADFGGSSRLNGFFMQDPVGDGDPATSDGIFVYTGSAGYTYAVGDEVQVSGTVSEYTSTSYGQAYHLTELGSVSQLLVCSSENSVAPTNISLPLPAEADPASYLERYEGMLVTVNAGVDDAPLYVQQNYFQARFGQLSVAAGDAYTRLFNPNNGQPDSTAEDNLRRLIIVDDGSTAQNSASVPYYDPANPLRAGDLVAPLTGVIDQGAVNATSGSATSGVFPDTFYRLQPVSTPLFISANPRPEAATPPAVSGDITVSGFNVLNFFTTLDNTSSPAAPYDSSNRPRGADTQAEYDRQLDKLATAMTTLHADVFGLLEIESWDGANAVQTLVNALNSRLGGSVYAAVAYPAGFPQPGEDTSDYIKVAMIYDTTAVTPVGAALMDNNPINSRVPLAQTFRANASGEIFSVVINHFKSKGSCPASPSDANADYGQGCWTALRVQQAEELLAFIAQIQTVSGDPDVLVIGDLNSYGEEDPIAALTGADYGNGVPAAGGNLVNQIARYIELSQRYSYVYDAQAGYLDHSLATPNLSGQVSGAAFWHINADEPTMIDYDLDFNPAGLFDAATPYRASDHDPSITGLTLTSAPAQLSADLPLTGGMGQAIAFRLQAANPADGSAVPQAAFQLRLEQTVLSAVTRWQYYNPAAAAWQNVSLSQDGADVVASLDGSQTGLLAAGGTKALDFRITFAQPGTYTLSSSLVDHSLTGSPAIASAQDLIAIDQSLYPLYLPLVLQ
jgi:predicted extracellular nuclease